MANLKPTEKSKLENLFEMSAGYVLNLSNPAFKRFVLDTIKIDIYDTKYAEYGNSKANRLRALWQN